MTQPAGISPQRRLRILRLLLALAAALIVLYSFGRRPDQASSMEGFTCAGGKEGWQRAKAVTPDVVGPCNTGSVGICSTGFDYVRGTGWCRPRV